MPKTRTILRGSKHPRWKGGDKNRGSVAYCIKLLRYSRRQAKNGGYVPLGIVPENLAAVFTQHDGHCDLCGIHESEFKRPLLVDHNHTNGRFRGLICCKCNWLLMPVEAYLSDQTIRHNIEAYLR